MRRDQRKEQLNSLNSLISETSMNQSKNGGCSSSHVLPQQLVAAAGEVMRLSLG